MATVTSMVNKIKNLLKKCENYVDTKTHSTGTKYDNLSDAVDGVLDVSSGLIDPFGVVEITENGLHNVREYDSAYVEIASGGTDVSDTTATASDVVSGKVFHTSDGASTSGSLVINSITPSNSSPVALTSGSVYKPSSNGYAISSYSNITPSSSYLQSVSSGSVYKMGSSGYLINGYSHANKTPSTSGTSFASGWNYMNTAGYAYSSQPSTQYTWSNAKISNYSGSSSGSTTLSVTFDSTPKMIMINGATGSATTNVQMNTSLYYPGDSTYFRIVTGVSAVNNYVNTVGESGITRCGIMSWNASSNTISFTRYFHTKVSVVAFY